MKIVIFRPFLIMALLVVGGCALIENNEHSDFIYRTGHVTLSGCVRLKDEDGYIIGRLECQNIAVRKESDTINIEVGSNFGVGYEISNLTEKSCYVITHKVKFPEMLFPNGERQSNSTQSFNVGFCEGDKGSYSDVLSWVIEKEWEAVKGVWNFEVLLDGDTILNQNILAM